MIFNACINAALKQGTVASQRAFVPLAIFNRMHNKERDMQRTPGALFSQDRGRTALLAALLAAVHPEARIRTDD